MNIKIVIGLILFVVAVMSGVIGSIHNLKNVKGPKERVFVKRATWGFWIVVMSLLFFVYYLPDPYRFWVAGIYFVVCPILVYRTSRTHHLIRVLEERDRAE